MATTVTKSVTLIPSGNTGLTNMSIDSSYGITRGYTNADDTQYTRFNGTASTTGYVYFTFDTSEIPAGATITSVTARGKARVSNTTRVSSTVMQLYANTTAKGSNRTFASTTASTQTITAGSWTRTELNNLRLRIGGTFSSSTSSKRIDFYGADVTVTYTVTAYEVTASGDGTLNPSGTETVESGESYVLTISGLSSKPTVKDNNVDVTSSLTETTEVTDSLIPNGNTISGWYSNAGLTNMYDDADSDTRATFQLAGGSTGTVYLDMTDISIPSGATIKSVSCQATLEFGRNGSTSGFTSSCRMYAGNTAKGSSYNWVSSGSSDKAKTTYDLTVGSWTANEINNARFYLTATNNASSTRRYVYIYGVTFNVTYESDGVTYVYTLSNVSADHTIVVTAAASNKIFVKLNGTWTQATKAYKKVNGSWVEQSDLTTVFSAGTNYVKGN